jgi:hypothetical protein
LEEKYRLSIKIQRSGIHLNGRGLTFLLCFLSISHDPAGRKHHKKSPTPGNIFSRGTNEIGRQPISTSRGKERRKISHTIVSEKPSGPETAPYTPEIPAGSGICIHPEQKD